MTFPSEEYIKFVLDHPELQDGWEPRVGDWVVAKKRHYTATRISIVTSVADYRKEHPNLSCQIYLNSQPMPEDSRLFWCLFRLDQLLRMIAETGEEIAFYGPDEEDENWLIQGFECGEAFDHPEAEIAVAELLLLVREAN